MMRFGGGPFHQVLGRDPSLVAGAHVDRGLLRRVWQFARPYRLMLALFLAAIIVDSLVGLGTPLLARHLIDKTIPSRNLHGVTIIGLAMVGLALADAGLSIGQRWWSARIGEGIIFDLRVALYDHVQRMPLAFFTRTQTGALVSRMNNDVIGAQQALTGTLGQVVSNAITVAITLVAMFALEWRLTLLALLVLPAFVFPAKRVGRRLQKITRESFQLDAAMNTTMTERFNVSGALLVKLFGKPDREAAEFSDKAGRVRDIGVKSAMYGRVFMTALALVGAVGTAAIYWFGARLVIEGALSLGTVIALTAYVARIYMPITALTNAHIDIMTAFVSFDRVFEVLDAPVAIKEKPGAYDLVDPVGRVEFDDVWFRYPAPSTVSLASLETDGTGTLSDEPSDWILRGVSLTIEPGQMVALVGPTGAGKTTMSMLVPRIYDVTAGAVRVDGHDVRDLTLESLAAAIGTVTQDAHMFHDTMAANLRYARPGATDAELVAACRAARIHNLIASLPDGYDTIVGERGYRLSGGEKQRLAIARVLLKQPALVILDEATAHLDSETELLVQQALDEALAARSSLVIAHRLSTIHAADEIVVVDGGRIVERGTHEQLIVAGGLYAELYETQYSRSSPPALEVAAEAD
ncbi:MAG: ABC transporter ATP-binding protein [Actinobacteria bacterium]|nr:MAG: ABC transporter ATP-binding protein [Actinomycetota bacterium]